MGVNRVIRVVSSGDLTFPLEESNSTATPPTMVFPGKEELVGPGLICMTTPGFAATLVILLAILIMSCLLSAFLCVRLRPFSENKLAGVMGYASSQKGKATAGKGCFYS